MVLSFVFFLYVLVFICMSFPVLLFCGGFFSRKKKNSLRGKSDQFHSQKKYNKGKIPIPLILLAKILQEEVHLTFLSVSVLVTC